MEPISLIASAVPGIIKGIGSLFGGGKRRREEKKARGQYNQQMSAFQNFQFDNAYEDLTNPYENVENELEDMRIATQASEFAAQEQQAALATTLDAVRGAAGGSGAAAIAQALAQQQSKKQQQIGIIMGFQSTEMFADDLNQIDFFARNGVRYMQLSYNGASQFGSGGLVKNDKGLKVLGQEALQRMEKNKVLVDLSHAGQKTVAQAIKESTRPLTISHTGCNGVYRHPRNNDDAELKAVADKGGVVGIYLMPFLEGGDSELKAEALLRHIDYAVNLCGEDHISIGSDQGVVPVNDGSAYREAIRQEVKRRIAAGISAPGETPNRPPFIAELNSEKRMELIAWHLSKRGYRCSQIEKILGLNLLQLYRAVW